MNVGVGLVRRAYVINAFFLSNYFHWLCINHHNSLDDMKRILKKLEKFKKSNKSSVTAIDTLGSSPEPVTSTSTIIRSIIDPILPVAGSPATASDQVIQAASANVSVQLST